MTQLTLNLDPKPVAPLPDFSGETYDRERDHARLSTCLGKVYTLMSDGQWRTLAEIAAAVGHSEAGCSARLRDLRRDKFRQRFPNGGIEHENCGGGLWKYRMIVVAT